MSIYNRHYKTKPSNVYYIKCYLNGYDVFFLKESKVIDESNISRFFWTKFEENAEVFLTIEQVQITLDFVKCRRTRENINFVIIEG
jgi:hypothetical protein